MENPGILNWRGWSIVRKAQIVAASSGALITIGMPLILSSYGIGPATYLLLVIWEVILWPAGKICSLFGWIWQFDGRGPLWIHTILATLTNTFLLSLVGTLIGLIVSTLRERRKTLNL